MTVVEFPRVQVSKALTPRRFTGVASSRRSLGRALLVGSPDWLETAGRAIRETETMSEAAWYEAWDFARGSGFLAVCRADVVVIAAEAAHGPAWRLFRDQIAALKPRPLLLALSCEAAGPDALQQLLDQGVDGVVSLHAVRLMSEELRRTLSHSSKRSPMHAPLVS